MGSSNQPAFAMNDTHHENIRLFVSRLAQSDLFLRYRDAFGLTTGRTLNLRAIDKHQPESPPVLPFMTVLSVPVEMSGRTVAQVSLDPIRLSDGEFPTFDEAARQML